MFSILVPCIFNWCMRKLCIYCNTCKCFNFYMFICTSCRCI